MLRIRTLSGRDLGKAYSMMLGQSLSLTLRSPFHMISETMWQKTVDHVEWRQKNATVYSQDGSRHWDVNKIKRDAGSKQGDVVSGGVKMDIPGADRAYRDILIRPIHGKYLAIPMHRDAYGLKPSNFYGLFRPKGKNALFMKKGSGIVAMFALARQAFQKQDSTLMPLDGTYVEEIGTKFFDGMEKNVATTVNKI